VHNDTPLDQARLSHWLASLAPIMTITAIIVAAAAPRSTPFMLLLLGGPVVALGVLTARELALRPLSPLVHTLLALGAYLALNSLWSVVPFTALGRVVLFGLILAMGWAMAKILPALSWDDADRLQRAIIYAVGATAFLLAFETLFGQPIRRFIVWLIPILRPDPKHIVFDNGWVAQISLYTLNRNVALLNLMLWPTLMLLRARAPTSKAWQVAGAALLAFSAIAIFSSEHETSMIALTVGVLVLVGMFAAATVTRAFVLAAWVAATLLVVPAANFAHEGGLHRVPWLPTSARNRIILWNVTADRMLNSPIFGIGIDSTKPLDQRLAPVARREPGDTYAQRTGRHAHNIFMQIWYELGATGALLVLIAGFAALRAMARLPSTDQPYIFASFASTMVLASFTWGLWQPWFMCAFGLWAVLLLVGLDAMRRSRSAIASKAATGR